MESVFKGGLNIRSLTTVIFYSSISELRILSHRYPIVQLSEVVGQPYMAQSLTFRYTGIRDKCPVKLLARLGFAGNLVRFQPLEADKSHKLRRLMFSGEVAGRFAVMVTIDAKKNQQTS